MPNVRKYTKELLAPAVAQSVSIMEVMRRVGVRTWTGGSHNLIADRIREYGLDVSHFTGQGTNRGESHKGGAEKLPWRKVLVKNRVGRREHRFRLERAMIESGIPHVCALCGMEPVWSGKPLVFDIDHKNGDRLDNRRCNVRFLCPNCHSQTPTNGFGNTRICPGGGMVDTPS